MKKLLILLLPLALCYSVNAQNQDCSTALVICSDGDIPGNSSGSGASESFTIPNCCTEGSTWGENQSSWFVISPTTTGTIAFTLTSGSGIDYDFAIWGPTATTACPPAGNPLRCSGSDGSANNSVSTGMAGGSGDNCEGPSGDDFINPITVSAGDVNQFYTILINNFTAENNPFNLDWTGTASLTCTPLPIQLISFEAENSSQGNKISWSVGSEEDIDYYELSYSSDGKTFYPITKIDVKGNANTTQNYNYLHESPLPGMGYYSLKTFNTDGNVYFMKIISVENELKLNSVRFFPNPTEGKITVQYSLPQGVSAQFHIFDLTGKLVFQQEIQSNHQQEVVNLNLPKGMYYGKFITRAGVLKTMPIVIH